MLICELRRQGLTLQEISDRLNRGGSRTPRGGLWQPRSVHNQLPKDATRMAAIVRALRSSDEIKDIADCMRASHCVYTWQRGTEWLYIGCTANLNQRLRTHNIIGKLEDVQDGDTITLWPFSDEHNAFWHEASLIAKHQPRHNIQNNPNGSQVQAANLNRVKGQNPIADALGISAKSLRRLAGIKTDRRKRNPVEEISMWVTASYKSSCSGLTIPINKFTR